MLLAATALLLLSRGAAAVKCTPSSTDLPPGRFDLVVSFSKACDAPENAACDSCKLWQMASQAKSPALGYIYSGSKSGVHRAKIIPTRALPGLESAARDGHDTSLYWVQALADAAKGGGTLPTGLPHKARSPLAFANSLAYRDQHQLHIHVGDAANANFSTCAAKIVAKPPAAGVWTGPSAYDPKSSACRALGVGGRDVAIYATSSAGDKISSTIRSGFRSGKVVSEAKSNDIVADPALARTAVLVLRPNPTGNYVVFLISNTNDEKVFGNKT
jgi:hypothetical protein